MHRADIEMIVTEGVTKLRERSDPFRLKAPAIKTPVAGQLGIFELGKTPKPAPDPGSRPSLKPYFAIGGAGYDKDRTSDGHCLARLFARV